MARADTITKLAAPERLDCACTVLVEMAGMSNFAITGEVARRLGLSRRSAQRILARAREQLRDQLDGKFADLRNSLPEAYADALTRARRAGTIRTEAKLLADVVNLVGRIGDDDDGGGAMPEAISFWTWDGEREVPDPAVHGRLDDEGQR